MRALLLFALAVAALPARAEPVSAIVGSIYSWAASAVAAASWGTIISAALTVVSIASTAYSTAQQKRRARQEAASKLQQDIANLADRRVTLLQSDSPHAVVYGSPGRIGGAIVGMVTTGAGAQWTHIVMVFAAHPCEAIEEIYIDDDAVLAGADGWTTNEALFKQPGGFMDFDHGPMVHVGIHLSPGGVDVADQWLIDQCNGAIGGAPGMWTADHKLSGFTYAIVSVNKIMDRFQGGPPTITAKVRGKASILDIRTGLRGYSRNPALCLADFITSEQGYGASWDQIDAAALIAAANACDVEVYGGEADGDAENYGNSRALYVCDGMFRSDQDRDSTRQQLEESMAGFSMQSGGVWRIHAGAWTTPVLSLGDVDMLQPSEVVQTANPGERVYNTARGTYVNAAQNGVSSDFAQYQNATFLALDPRAKICDMALAFTGAHVRCHQLARVRVERSRGGLVLRIYPKMLAWHLQPGDRILLSSDFLGFENKPFTVTDWLYGGAAPLTLEVEEDESAFYDTADEVLADAAPNSNLPNPYAPPAPPHSLKVESGRDQLAMQVGSAMVRARVSWAQSASSYVLFGGRVRVQWRTGATDPGQADAPDAPPWNDVELAGDAVETFLLGLDVGEDYTVRVRFETTFTASAWAYAGHTLEGNTGNPAEVQGLALWVAEDGIRARWGAPVGVDQIEWDGTQVRRGATWPAGAADVRFDGRALTASLGWFPAGAQSVWAAHRSMTGRWSSPISAGIAILPPAAAVPRFELTMQFVQLTWADCRTTQPVSHYVIRQGAAWETAETVGQATGTSFSLQGRVGASTYWVAAVDVAGNAGAPGAVNVTVDQLIEGALEVLDKQLGDAFELLQQDLTDTNRDWAAAVAAEAQNRAAAVLQAAQKSAGDLAIEAQARAAAITAASAAEAQQRAAAIGAEAQARAADMAAAVVARNAAIQQSAAALQASIDALHVQLGDIIGAAEYDPAQAYEVGELVKSGGKLYRSIAATVGNAPPNAVYWQLVGNYDSLGEAVAALAAQTEDHSARIQQTEEGLTAQASQIGGVASRLQTVERDSTAHSGAIVGLQSFTSDINGRLTSAAQNVLDLQALTRLDLGGLVRDGQMDRAGTWLGVARIARSAAGVPAGAPTPYVGFLTGRDSYEYGQAFNVRRGDRYWATATAASASAALPFTVGFHFHNPETNQHHWHAADAIYSTAGAWRRLEGEVPAPDWATVGEVWLQINGSGDLSGEGWYVTNIDARNIASQGVTKAAIQAQATANQATSARVDQQGSTLASHSSDILRLTGDVAGKADATVVQSIQQTVQQHGADLTTQSGQLVSLANRMTGAEGTTAAQAGLIGELQSNVSSINGQLTAHTQRLDQQQAAIGTKASASALDATNVTVGTLTGQLGSEAARTTALTARMDNLAVGAANLLTGTRDWTSLGLRSGGTTLDGEFRGLKVLRSDGAWQYGTFPLRVDAGQTYALSFWGRSTAENPASGGVYWFNGTKEVDWVLTGEMRRYAWLFTPGETVDVQVRIESHNASPAHPIWIAGLKVERGNVVTDWAPSAGDLSAADARLIAESSARVDADSALSGQLVSMAGQVAGKADSSALQAVQQTVQQHGSDIAAQSTRYDGLAARVGTVESKEATNAGAISQLQAGATQFDGRLNAQAQDVVVLDAKYDRRTSNDGANWIDNPALIATADGWSLTERRAATDADVPAGAPSAYVAHLQNRDVFVGRSVTVSPGGRLYASAWMARGAPATYGAAVGFAFLDRNGIVMDFRAVGGLGGAVGQWEFVAGEVDVPAGAVAARGWFQIGTFSDYAAQRVFAALPEFRSASVTAAVRGTLAAQAQALQQTTARLDQQGSDIASQSGQLVSLTNRMTGAEGTSTAQAGLIGELQSNVSSISGQLTAHTQRLDQQQAAIGTKASASALDATNVTVGNLSTQLGSEAARTTALTARMDNLAVGAANLLTGTQDWSGAAFSWGANALDGEVHGLKVLRSDGNWAYRSFAARIEADQPYVFSFWGRCLPGANNHVGIFWFTGHDEQSFLLTGEWKRYSWAFRRSQLADVYVRIEPWDAAGDRPVWVAGLKLERGTVATDWTPSPGDLSAADARLIAEAKARADADTAQSGQLVSLAGQVAGKADSSALQSVQQSVQQQGADIAAQSQRYDGLASRVGTVEGKEASNSAAIGVLQASTTDINGRLISTADNVVNLQALTRLDLGSLVRDGRMDRAGTWTDLIRTPRDAAGVPPGAPTPFVGFKVGRDSYEHGQGFYVKRGERYWAAATVASSQAALPFTLGFHFYNPQTNQHHWHAADATYTTAGQWKRLEGEVPVPDWAVSADLWMQIGGGGDLSGEGWYVTDVDARNISSQSVTKAAIQAQATANQATSARVDQQGSDLAAQAASVTTLKARADGFDSKAATIEQSLSVTATTAGKALARYTFRLDVDGRISGMVNDNDGQTSRMAFLTDVFSITSPGYADKPVFTVGTVGGAGALGFRGDMYLDGSITARSLSVQQLSAITGNLGTIYSASIVLQSGTDGGGEYWGTFRTPGKWFNDGQWGFVFGRRGTDGAVGVDITGPNMGLQMFTWANHFRFFGPGFELNSWSGLTINAVDVIDTLTVRGGAITTAMGSEGTDYLQVNFSVPAGQTWRVACHTLALNGDGSHFVLLRRHNDGAALQYSGSERGNLRLWDLGPGSYGVQVSVKNFWGGIGTGNERQNGHAGYYADWGPPAFYTQDGAYQNRGYLTAVLHVCKRA
ncbi:hypothetical protein [Pseudacidovorax intermedius]|uniref:DUF1983 domain-containing protein n=1 Tax=Pseudacidovorax intermedius TaxID=433924 RepID=A0A147H005_9BURK|nr:hypothetical protein [Pseudacidovorax intermedius]KTT23234.1 hypothetical protein NS331_08440 [Pseudacidovorax intermedius]